MVHEAAIKLLEDEEQILKAIATDDTGQKACSAGLAYLAYMRSQWMPRAMWEGWSRKGRIDAAKRMGIPVEGVLPTTNHLEAFNGSLKKNHLPQWQHSGARLRFDLLIFHLTCNILPRVYGRHRMLVGYRTWKTERFRPAAGGKDLHTLHRLGTDAAQSANSDNTAAVQPQRPWFYFQPDTRRDVEAEAILRRALLRPISSVIPFELWAECASSSSAPSNTPPILYQLTFHPSGSATCTCPDWLTRGGACKHLRAFRLVIDSWSASGGLGYQYASPTSLKDALEVDEANRLWYGSHYERSITAPRSRFHSDSGGHPEVPLPLTQPGAPVVLPPPTTADASCSLEHEMQLLETMTQATGMCSPFLPYGNSG